MRILFAISLVALAALLWASVSIAQHIYRSRKQQRQAARERRTKTPATPAPRTASPLPAPRPTVLRNSEIPRRKAS
jgi:hypothetical protein